MTARSVAQSLVVVLIVAIACDHIALTKVKKYAFSCATNPCKVLNDTDFLKFAVEVPLLAQPGEAISKGNIPVVALNGNKPQDIYATVYSPDSLPARPSKKKVKGQREHIWGILANNTRLIAAPGSMLMYAVGSPATATFPGAVLVANQAPGDLDQTCGSATSFNLKIRWLWDLLGVSHPFDWGFEPSLCANQANILYDYPKRKIQYTAKSTSPTSRIPVVTHIHGIVASAKADGLPQYTLSGFGNYAQVTDSHCVTNPTALLLYHDHAFCFTRLNVLAGLVGPFLVLPAANDTTNPANTYMNLPGREGLPPVKLPHYPDPRDIPLIFQDRAFQVISPPNVSTKGWKYVTADLASVDYARPNNPQCFTNTTKWFPEFFGNIATVNGVAYPKLTLTTDWYKFRFVNGANTRSMVLKSPLFDRNCWKVATEAGYVKTPELVGTDLLLYPALRIEVLCDWTNVTEGNYPIYTTPDTSNLGINFPFSGDLMLVTITKAADKPAGTRPNLIGSLSVGSPVLNLNIPSLKQLYDEQVMQDGQEATKTILLSEDLDLAGCSLGLGINEVITAPDGTQTILPRVFGTSPMPVPITCREGKIEKWDFMNPTADAHPMHWHLNHVQCTQDPSFTDATTILKDTVPIPTGPMGNVTISCYVTCAAAQRIIDAGKVLAAGGTPSAALNQIKKGYYKSVGLAPTCPASNYKLGQRANTYVFHCHILEHEENDMMSKMEIIPKC